ncbi:helix-turn-helix domain-containing protein [Streptomyces sp. NPDC060010]|uniref:helix-turn-helix domain-containing protein n=1 Tax=Streptomyces sp. NPDC060010 TaxID=3347036 RepID=UPI0036844FDF
MEPQIGGQLRCLRAACGHVRFPLRDRCPVVELPAQGKGIREVARQVRRDPATISRELRRLRIERSHAATLPPADSIGRRNTS